MLVSRREEGIVEGYDVREIAISSIAREAADLQRLIDPDIGLSPFQSAEWIMAWWKAFGQHYDPYVIAVQHQGTVIGIFPLMSRRSSLLTTLEWIGTGRSDHAPMLLAAGHERAAISSLLFHLRKDSSRWHLLSLRTLRSHERQQFESCTAGLGDGFDFEDVSPCLSLEGSWEGYLQQKSSKHRGNLVRGLKRAEQDESISIACERIASEQLLLELANVEAMSWKATEGELRLAGDGMHFFRYVLEAMARNGWLEIWTFRHQSDLLAYLVTFHVHNRVYYYNGAYRRDSESRVSRLSIGTVLISCAIREAFARKAHSFDFLRGDEPYKALWTSSRSPLSHFVMANRSLRGRIGMAWIRLRWYLRRQRWAKDLHRAVLALKRRLRRANRD